MSILRLTLITILFAGLGCNSKDETTAPVEPKNDKLEFAYEIYNFGYTNDPEFCNADSIIAGDIGGTLFLNDTGACVINYWNVGQDSASYELGKYTKTENGVECFFDTEIITVDNTFAHDTAGKYSKRAVSIQLMRKGYSLKLTKSKCPKVAEYYTSSTGEDLKWSAGIVYHKTEEKDFLKFINALLIINQYLDYSDSFNADENDSDSNDVEVKNGLLH